MSKFTKAQKEKYGNFKTKTTFTKKIQDEFNAMMARGKPCAKCGNIYPVMQCSHIWSIGSYPNLRFDPMNVLPMCGRHHNYWWHLEPAESIEWFTNTYPGRYDYLIEAKNKLVHRTLDDLQEVRDKIKERNLRGLLIAPELLDKE
jgi:hypothetical protein